MKLIFSLFLTLTLPVFAANPSFQSFNTNQFTITGNIITVDTNFLNGISSNTVNNIIAGQPVIYATNEPVGTVLAMTNALVVPTRFIATNSANGLSIEITGDTIIFGGTILGTVNTNVIYTLTAADAGLSNKRFTNQTAGVLYRIQSGNVNVTISNDVPAGLWRARNNANTLTNKTQFGEYVAEATTTGTVLVYPEMDLSPIRVSEIIVNQSTAGAPTLPTVAETGVTNFVIRNVPALNGLWIWWETNSVLQSNKLAGP